MTKSLAPIGITKLTTYRCTISESKQNCSCRVNNLARTEDCLCMADEGCCNPLNEVYFVMTIPVTLRLNDKSSQHEKRNLHKIKLV